MRAGESVRNRTSEQLFVIVGMRDRNCASDAQNCASLPMQPHIAYDNRRVYAALRRGKPRCFVMDPNPTDLHVGAQLRARRMALGISDEKFADALGVSLQQVLAWELGVTRIGATWLFKIAQILDVDPGYFFKHAEPSRLH